MVVSHFYLQTSDSGFLETGTSSVNDQMASDDQFRKADPGAGNAAQLVGHLTNVHKTWVQTQHCINQLECTHS